MVGNILNLKQEETVEKEACSSQPCGPTGGLCPETFPSHVTSEHKAGVGVVGSAAQPGKAVCVRQTADVQWPE